MTDERMKVILGGLLHDVGKVVYRAGALENHSVLGERWLRQEGGLEDKEILNQIRYHHGKELTQAKGKLSDDSFAYITYVADNISAGLDRRKEKETFGYDQGVPLASIFNYMNHNQGNSYYLPKLQDVNEIAYPVNQKISCDQKFYDAVLGKLKDCLSGMEYQEEFLESFLEVSEAVLSFIPSSTSKEERGDVSLYDHSKLTAAVGSCIHAYLSEKGIKNYRSELFENSKKFYGESAFCLCSMDISGIQDFIYTIASDRALKALRVRSFYLEILMEHCIDELLFSLELSRCNLLYSGGGHAYLLLPGTKEAKDKLLKFEKMVNQWLLENFKTALYLGVGYRDCSAGTLMNEPDGSYEELFRSVSTMISRKKLHRYDADALMWLNRSQANERTRECKVCHRSDHLTKEDKCRFCLAIENMSAQLLKKAFFVITKGDDKNALPLPFSCSMKVMDKEAVIVEMKKPEYVRTYGKNQVHTGFHVTKFWFGDYAARNTFEELAQASVGTKKIAVLRADVDNLGKSFVHGFESEADGNKFVTLSRTSTFSRKMSIYFKKHINNILEHGECYITEKVPGPREAVVVYTGGDDLFIVGSWDDIIGFALDLYHSFQKYTQGTLSFSAGIGIYDAKFPIANIAEMTGKLEDCAKSIDGKNAVALFDRENTYPWKEFQDQVIDGKYRILNEFFSSREDKGRTFLYQLLELFRDMDGVEERPEKKINLARLAYLIARMRPSEKMTQGEKEKLYHFSEQIYDWIKNKQDRKQMITAIYLYAYKTREME